MSYDDGWDDFDDLEDPDDRDTQFFDSHLEYGDYDDDEDDRSMFADPGGNSALRAATPDNPRDRNCPNCGAENVLTREDEARGYQCDRCATIAEGGFPYGMSIGEY
jgi:hypothetical protein